VAGVLAKDASPPTRSMSLWGRVWEALTGGPIGDIGTDEQAVAAEDGQMTVTIPPWTRKALAKAKKPESASNGLVRESAWGEIVGNLPWGSVVDVFSSTVAPEPHKRAVKKWYLVRSIDDADITGWMHEDILR
jgi:hypothetical protein